MTFHEDGVELARLDPRKIARHLPLPAAYLFLSAAIVAASHSIPGPLWSPLKWNPSDAATACAGFGTVAAIFFGLHQFSNQRMAERSKFALDMAMEGVRQAYRVIEGDLPTRNLAWVNAARLVLRSRETSVMISEQDHQIAWDLFREEWRIRFFGILRADPKYFFGIGKWEAQPERIIIDDEYASKIATEIRVVSDFTAPNVSATSYEETTVSENAIKAIFDFTEYDDAWSDPIRDRSGFGRTSSDAVFQRNMRGLWGYLEVRRKYHLGGGEAKRRLSADEELH